MTFILDFTVGCQQALAADGFSLTNSNFISGQF